MKAVRFMRVKNERNVGETSSQKTKWRAEALTVIISNLGAGVDVNAQSITEVRSMEKDSITLQQNGGEAVSCDRW